MFEVEKVVNSEGWSRQITTNTSQGPNLAGCRPPTTHKTIVSPNPLLATPGTPGRC